MATLIKSISDSDTVIMFTEDASFPAVNGVIVIGTENIAYDTNYMGTLYGCVRGVNSTSAAAHTAGVTVTLLDFFHALAGESGSFTSVTVTGLTASKAVVTNGSKVLASSATSATELGYVAGVTSAIQTQLNSLSSGKADLAGASFTGDVAVAEDQILAFGDIDASDFSVTLNSGSTNLEVAHNGTIDLSITPTGVVSLAAAAQFDANATATNTRMLLWDVDKGALSRVSVGANNSGGSGFKLLRVPN